VIEICFKAAQTDVNMPTLGIQYNMLHFLHATSVPVPVAVPNIGQCQG